MKINKKNVIIPSLLTTISAALVGSIAGTVAWYQYNTRVSASYMGTSAGSATENLQLRLGDNGEWKAELKAADIQAYLDSAYGREGSDAIRPVTSGELPKDGKLGNLYKNPIYQHEKTETWGQGNAKEDFITFPIHLRVLDVDGNQNDEAKLANLEKSIYFQDVVLKGSQTNDITNAIRLHVSSNTNVNANISAEGAKTKVHGALDLLNDGIDQLDLSEGYEFDDDRHVIDYGVDPAEIKGYVAHEADLLLENDYFLVDFNNTEASDDKYYQFNGSAWVESDAEPASGRNRGLLHKAAELPAVVAEDDVYFAYEDDKLFILKDTGAWEEKEVVAESYKMDSAELIADDTDPDNLVGGKELGKTRASVQAFANLPENAHAGDKVYVRENTVENAVVTHALGMYEFDGSDWNLIDLEANDKYFQWDEAASQWNEIDMSSPVTGNYVGEIAEEANLPANPDDQDYVKITYASEDAENSRQDLTLNLTIYLEGWQKLDGKAIWDAGYIGTEYKVGMTFVCEAR